MESFIKFIGYVLLVASVFIFGLKGMNVEMGIAVAASFVFLAFANLDKFTRFKGAGFEAELKQAVNEANATIENLKDIAKTFILTGLFSLTQSGRFTERVFNKDHDLYDQLVNLQIKYSIENVNLEK